MGTARRVVVQGLRWTGRIAAWIVFAAALVLLLLYLAGRFQPKVDVAQTPAAPTVRPVAGEVVAVQRVRVPRRSSWGLCRRP